MVTGKSPNKNLPFLKELYWAQKKTKIRAISVAKTLAEDARQFFVGHVAQDRLSLLGSQHLESWFALQTFFRCVQCI